MIPTGPCVASAPTAEARGRGEKNQRERRRCRPHIAEEHRTKKSNTNAPQNKEADIHNDTHFFLNKTIISPLLLTSRSEEQHNIPSGSIPSDPHCASLTPSTVLTEKDRSYNTHWTETPRNLHPKHDTNYAIPNDDYRGLPLFVGGILLHAAPRMLHRHLLLPVVELGWQRLLLLLPGK